MRADEGRTGRVALAVALAGVVGFALLLRLPDLGAKCLHSDEGVNGWFTLRLYWWNVYHYRASDYHGPLLYYVNLLMFHVFGGPSDFALRIGTVLAGALTPVALWPLRRHLTGPGVLVAGVLIAAGPCLVYFSRTVIHEVYLVLGTTLWLAALARFALRPSLGWALTAAVSAFVCFSSKETAIITLGCLGIGVGVGLVFGRRVPDEGGLPEPDAFAGLERTAALRSWFGDWRPWLAGGVLFFALVVLLFSSFGTYWTGVAGFFEALGPWLEHGTSGRNQKKDWLYFWEVMRDTEGWATWPAIAACLLAAVKRHRFGLVLTGWALASFAVYSAIPYKTPWCVLNIDLPTFLLNGWLAGQAWLMFKDAGAHPVARTLALPVLLVPLLGLPTLVETVQLDNTERFDDDAVPYVYVQTLRGQFDMVSDHLGVAAATPDYDGRGVNTINVSAKNPARWYLITRGWDHTRVRYLGDVPEEGKASEAKIVVVTGVHKGHVERLLMGLDGAAWHKENYGLRPGWSVDAYYRQDLWDAYQAAGGRDAWAWPVPESSDVFEPKKPKRYLTRREKRQRAQE